MSILSKPTPKIPTPEDKLRNIKHQIKNLSLNSYNQLCQTQKRGIDLVWHNREFTPQEIIDSLGEDAIKIFQYHGALTEYIVTLAVSEGLQPDIKLPTHAFTVQDGTITVLDEPYNA
jgi:hypothetical protein